MNTALEILYRLILGPRALLFWATVIVIGFGIVHVLGWREYTTVLSGTIPSGNSEAEAGFKALAYMMAYFSAVLLSPIFLIAAGFTMLIERLLRSRETRPHLQ